MHTNAYIRTFQVSEGQFPGSCHTFEGSDVDKASQLLGIPSKVLQRTSDG
jgi:hypothetical protein